jgi:hypothetical protein
MDGCPLIAEDAARDRRAALGEPTQGARGACRPARPALSDILNASDTDAAIVGTRSALIMIKNLLALGEQFSYDRYEPYRIPNGELSVWVRRGNTEFSHSETRVPLPSATPY